MPGRALKLQLKKSIFRSNETALFLERVKPPPAAAYLSIVSSAKVSGLEYTYLNKFYASNLILNSYIPLISKEVIKCQTKQSLLCCPATCNLAKIQ